jgi:hypothetical protein
MNLIQSIKRRINFDINENHLIRFNKSCIEYLHLNDIEKKKVILWPTPFNLEKHYWPHDGILSMALRIRGAKIIPTICGQVQGDECVIYGGAWQETMDSEKSVLRNAKCNQCDYNSKRMWKHSDLNLINLSHLLDNQQQIYFQKQAITLYKSGNIKELKYHGYALGEEVDKVINNLDLQLFNDDLDDERRKNIRIEHIYNVLVLFKVYEIIFEKYKPDCIVGNGGYYYQWGVVGHLAAQFGIPYYRYNNVGWDSPDWVYGYNNHELIDVSDAWVSWQKNSWTAKKNNKVEKDLIHKGIVLLGKERKISIRKDLFNKLALDVDKTTLLAPTGVAWDATSRMKSKCFDNIYDWIFETIDWFTNHTDYQLIVRVHPAENIVSSIAQSHRTTFLKELSKRNIELSPNVKILSYDSDISTYDLFPVVDVGCVFSSTTGLEMACYGIPTFCHESHYSDKGFTIDPQNKDDYRALLESALSGEIKKIPENFSELAKKYYYLYYFHRSVLQDYFTNDYLQMNRLSVKDILPGKNKILDYFCDSVLNNLPLYGKNRWIPDSNY